MSGVAPNGRGRDGSESKGIIGREDADMGSTAPGMAAGCCERRVTGQSEDGAATKLEL
jgi:hypothetical protein